MHARGTRRASARHRSQTSQRTIEVAVVQDRRPALESKGGHPPPSYRARAAAAVVFFVDEIHRIARSWRDRYSPAMEDRRNAD